MEDQYEKRATEKAERISKNKKRARRNAEEAASILAGKPATLQERKSALETAIISSRTSTASLGRFDKQLEGDSKIKSGMKRKV